MIAPQCLRLSPTDWPSSEWLITHIRCVCVCVCVSFFFAFFYEIPLRRSAPLIETAVTRRLPLGGSEIAQ